MSVTSFRANVESLESRLNLSTIKPSVLSVVPLQGSGTGQVTSTSVRLDRVLMSATVTGRSAGLGAFTGSGNAAFVPGTPARGTGVVELRAANGDTLDLSIRGSYRVVKPGDYNLPAAFKFTITGGTGALKTATGSGTITGVLNSINGAFRFRFNGRALV